MEHDPVTVDSEREEGEIVEDELEDVSDCSIGSPVFSGKSVLPTETLRPVSLSSISDSECEDFIKNDRSLNRTRKRKKSFIRPHKSRKDHNFHKKRSKYGTVDLNLSDSDEDRLDHRTLKQLKEAVRIETSQEFHHRSLRTRLEGMIEPHIPILKNDMEKELICVHMSSLETHEKSKDINKEQSYLSENKNSLDSDEKELAELRLEALKSAILNKHQVRKKRKAEQLQSDGSSSDVKNDNSNKENAQSMCNKDKMEPHKENKNEMKINDETSIDDDPDIMRAMLLASVTHKLTTQAKSTNQIQSAKNDIVKNITTKTNLIQKSSVIKNTANSNKPFRNFKSHNLIVKNKKINSSAKFFANVKPLIIKVNNESDSDQEVDNSSKDRKDNISESVVQLLKKQRAEVEANLSSIQQKQIKTPHNIMNKSAVKLLPKSQQLEYRKLIRILNYKKKLARARKLTQKYPEHKKETLRKTCKLKQTVNNISKRRNEEIDVKQLQRTLLDVQINKNGRFVLKGKYQALAPILQQINKVSEERKKCENLIKQFLHELQIARNNYTSTNESYKSCLQKLIEEKCAIDRVKTNNIVIQNTMHTSTPINSKNNNGSSYDLSKVNVSKVDKVCVESKPASQNEIDGIINRKENKNFQVKMSVPKYTSPLNPSNEMLDPLATICPYDLMGDCRDVECTFKHCS